MSRYLTPKEQGRINFAIREKIMHFSPTISPAPKDYESGEIESLRKAILYFAENGAEKIIIQPKYMGSYCDVYLAKNIEETRFFTRRGFPIRKTINRSALIDALRELHSRIDWGRTSVVVIQSELMPWALLGGGLIDRDFGGYSRCHAGMLDYIKADKLDEQIEALRKDNEYISFLAEKGQLTRAELTKKFKHHIVSQYEALEALQVPDPVVYEEALRVFDEQLELYGKSGDIEFKPFNVLKVVYDDGTEELNSSNIDGWEAVRSKSGYNPFMIIDCNERSLESQIDKAYELFEEAVSNGLEGVIVKPDLIHAADRVPMFKVRNDNYLQMIYGISFLDNYDYYLGRRGINKKMRCSVNEWSIAQELLKIPMNEISEDNERYAALVKARILEEDFETSLDTRL